MSSFFGKQLGIDLGTANTLVYVPGGGVRVREPSVVAVSKTDDEILAVGSEAKKMVGKTPDDIVAYRPLKDGVIADYRVTEAMLEYYIDAALRVWDIFKPTVLISVPAGVTSTQRRAVTEAAIRAGASEAHLVKEPVLAAMGADLPIQDPSGNMVMDIGGGTTDIAVISVGGVVSSLSTPHAGNSIDSAIHNHLNREHNISVGEKMAERIKINIGSAVPVGEEKAMEIRGRDNVEGLPETIEIRTNEVTKAIGSELHNIVDGITQVLKETPPELSSDIVENEIVMTGGGAKLYGLDAFVSEHTGVGARLADSAEYCVAHGTGVALQHLDTYKKEIATKRS